MPGVGAHRWNKPNRRVEGWGVARPFSTLITDIGDEPCLLPNGRDPKQHTSSRTGISASEELVNVDGDGDGVQPTHTG